MSKIIIIIVAIAATTAAAAASEQPTAAWRLGNGWSSSHRASGDEIVKFGVALRQRNVAELQALVDEELSNPTHSNYAGYLQVSDLAALVGRADEEVEKVKDWLGCGQKQTKCLVSATKDYVRVEMTVARAEQLFRVELFHHTHERARASVVRAKMVGQECAEVFVPAEVRALVDMVLNIADLPPVPTHSASTNTLGDFPGINITPAIIRKYYNVPTTGLANKPVPASTASLAEFEQAYFYQTDVDAFEKKFGAAIRNVTVVGINDPDKGYLGEASLDTQYMAAMTVNAPVWVFSLDQFDLVAWAQEIMSTKNAPLIHSVSWGSAESGFDLAQATRINTEFMKMASLGYTLACASGDSGTDHSGLFSCGHFEPTFPASSPYCLAVGGTYLPTAPTDTDMDDTVAEIGWSGSGGGFSNYFAQPKWQQSVVATYQSQSGLPSTQYWNKTGRGSPDVSALATNFQVLSHGYMGSITGTSAATPTYAALLTLINDIRVGKGGKPLGLVAPLLYQAKTLGQDITSGNNRDPSCPAGFPALQGWDAITGLGTPQWSDLLQALSS